MDDYKVLKFLSQGLMGKVYLVSKDGKKYAMKVEYILSENDPSVKNELKFLQEVASKHPEQFIQLVDYEFIQDCKEEAPKIPDWVDENAKKYFLTLRNSKVCVRKIYSLIDNTLSDEIIRDMNLKERYSMLIQLLYINYLIQSNGFVHGDFHRGNIGLIKVEKDKKIKILGKDIPTYGNQFVAIDYGGILHRDTLNRDRKYQDRETTELEHFQEHFIIDKLGIINNMVSTEDFWNYVKDNKIKMNDIEEDSKLILSQPEIKFLKDISNNKYLLFDLYKLLFTKKFQELVLRENFKEKIPFISWIPTADIIYAYSNFEDDILLINYFIARLENL